jgi:Uma2 family endonuclease
MADVITRRRFTVDEYQRMGQVGILCAEDRVELINGEIVAMTPIGSRHNACVNSANRSMGRAAGDDAIIQVQGSVRLDLYSEPEPDIVLLRPRHDFYVSQLPGPADILLIIEIAESSMDYDREVKARLYAQAGVPEYWIADLNTNVVWCYRSLEQGAYQIVAQFKRGQSIAPQHLLTCLVAVDVFLIE